MFIFLLSFKIFGLPLSCDILNSICLFKISFKILEFNLFDAYLEADIILNLGHFSNDKINIFLLTNFLK